MSLWIFQSVVNLLLINAALFWLLSRKQTKFLEAQVVRLEREVILLKAHLGLELFSPKKDTGGARSHSIFTGAALSPTSAVEARARDFIARSQGSLKEPVVNVGTKQAQAEGVKIAASRQAPQSTELASPSLNCGQVINPEGAPSEQPQKAMRIHQTGAVSDRSSSIAGGLGQQNTPPTNQNNSPIVPPGGTPAIIQQTRTPIVRSPGHHSTEQMSPSPVQPVSGPSVQNSHPKPIQSAGGQSAHSPQTLMRDPLSSGVGVGRGRHQEIVQRGPSFSAQFEEATSRSSENGANMKSSLVEKQAGPATSIRGSSREAFDRATMLLSSGVSIKEIARLTGLSTAELQLMNKISARTP